MLERTPLVYVFDASALIDMQNELWPVQNFPGVWTAMGALADSGRVLVFEGAKDECKDEELVDWFDRHPSVVIGLSQEIEDCVKTIMADLTDRGKRLVDAEALSSDADPFVIACAMAHNHTSGGSYASGRYLLVQHETSAGNSPRRAKIPDVCAWYGVRCLRALDVVRQENWVFPLDPRRPKNLPMF